MRVRLTWTDKTGQRCETLSDEVVCKGEAINIWAMAHQADVEADIWPRGVVVVTCCQVLIDCDQFTATCDKCGADYNSSGQRLAPRSQWGNETGEHWSECY